MKITRMKTNHLTNPLGYELSVPRVSFYVEDTVSKKQEAARIVVASDEAFENIVYDTGKSTEIKLTGTELPFVLKPRTRYYWTVEVWGDTGDYAKSDAAWFETAKMDEIWEGKWIGSTAGEDKNPVLVKEFSVKEDYPDSRIYVTGLGLYELYLDGERVGNEYLTPGCTDYNQWIQYQTYEVHIAAGAHRLEVHLADGWYKGRFGFDGGAENIYGDRCQMILELIMKNVNVRANATASDGVTGREEKIVSDESWEIGAGDVVFSNIYDGEVYAPSSGGKPHRRAEVSEGPTDRLTARYGLPVVIKEEIRPIGILHTPAGETVLDMGQNMTGFVRFYADEPKGTKIYMQFGEVLQEDNFYRDNLRTAKAEFTYISDGVPRSVQPHFTFYGFRYVKLEGFTGEPSLDQFTGCVLYSDLERTGWISTSHEKVNKLIENALWGQKCNYVDVPTDCPQRDERMGWTADTQVFTGTACFNMDSYSFLRKFSHDMYETQKELGHVTNVIPAFQLKEPACSVWGDAATVVPWNLYLYYGDVTILKEQFESMRQWVDSIKEIDEASGGRRLWDVGFHFGDWLALDNENADDKVKGGTEDGYIATAYYYYSAGIVAKAAKILGKEKEAEYYGHLSEEVKAALQREYFTPSGRLALTTQTAYALALYMDFAPEGSKERTIEFLKKKLKMNKVYLKTGFVGTCILNKVLSDYGCNEMAYKLLLNEEYPSWLYEVNMGATTVWERWNSILPDGRISGTDMNSLNHYAYGSVVEWMYRNMAGLRVEEENPGFTHVTIAPQPDYRITSCSMEYRSEAGTYKINWSVEKSGEFRLHVEVPFDAGASIVLPNVSGEPKEVCAGSYDFAYMPETPIVKVYSSRSSLGELMENPAALDVLARFLPEWEQIPAGMREMTVEMLNDTPYANLTEEQLAEMNGRLRDC